MTFCTRTTLCGDAAASEQTVSSTVIRDAWGSNKSTRRGDTFLLLVIGFLVLTVDHLTPYQSAKQGIKESHFEIKMSKREMSLFSVQQTPFFTSFVIVHERDARRELRIPFKPQMEILWPTLFFLPAMIITIVYSSWSRWY